MDQREIENFFSQQALISYRIFGRLVSGVQLEWCMGGGCVCQGWQPSLMHDSDQVKTWARGLALLVPGGGCNRNGTCWRAVRRLIGPKAKVLRGSNACRGELRRRAELHGLLVAFLRVGRNELGAMIDDIALMAHTALLHSMLVWSSAQLGFLQTDHNLRNSNLPSIPRSLVHTSLLHLVNITIVNHNVSPPF